MAFSIEEKCACGGTVLIKDDDPTGPCEPGDPTMEGFVEKWRETHNCPGKPVAKKPEYHGPSNVATVTERGYTEPDGGVIPRIGFGNG